MPVLNIPPVMDYSVLEELASIKSGNGPDMLLEILDTYLKSLPGQIREITASLGCGNLKKAAQDAHSIKPASNALGALRFGWVCQQIEDLQDPVSSIQCQELIESLQRAGDESAAEIFEIANRCRSSSCVVLPDSKAGS